MTALSPPSLQHQGEILDRLNYALKRHLIAINSYKLSIKVHYMYIKHWISAN